MRKHPVIAAAMLAFFLILPSCTGLFYQPSGKLYATPIAAGLPFREYLFTAPNGERLGGWWIPAAEGTEEKGTIIHFHGNAQNMTAHFMNVAWLAKEGYNLFVFDYEGYGASDGTATPGNVNGDALAALEAGIQITRERERQIGRRLKVIAYGQSLGGAALLRALAELPDTGRLSGVIEESGFYSYRTIARQKLAQRWFTWPVQWLALLLVSDGFSPEEHIASIAPLPLLVVHGDADMVVPVSHGRKIYELAGVPKEYWEIPGGGHIDAFHLNGGAYRPKLLAFLAALP